MIPSQPHTPKVLITGGAGFIAYHTADLFASRGWDVVLVDNLDPYYDPNLKNERIGSLLQRYRARFRFCDITNVAHLNYLFDQEPGIKHVVHLAARPGVRVATRDVPTTYRTNVIGTKLLLRVCEEREVHRIVYASSSSVYSGLDQNQPTHEKQKLSLPSSHYGVSKWLNEQTFASHASAHLCSLIGMRFFSVYGPWGRPDMAYWKFAQAIMTGTPLTLYGEGTMRDFTYCQDVAEAIFSATSYPDRVKYGVFNVGAEQPVLVEHMIELLSKGLGRVPNIVRSPLPPEDARITCSDNTKITEHLGWKPRIGLEEGISKFVHWYKEKYE